MAENVKELTVRLAFEHGDTKGQIQAIKDEVKLLESGFQAAAMSAGGFSGSLNESQARAATLTQQIQLQEQAVEKYGQLLEQARGRVDTLTKAHDEQGKKLEDARAKHQELAAEKEKLSKAMEAEAKAGGDNSEAYIEMSLRMDELNSAMAANEQEISTLEKAYERSDKAIQNADRSVQKLTQAQNLARAAAGGMRQELQETERRIRAHADELERAEGKLRQYQETAANAGKGQLAVGKTLSRVSVGIAAAGAEAVKSAIDWESAFAGVTKTVSGTEEQLKDIEDQLLSMEVPTSFEELADIAANAGQLGIATGNVASFTRTMADLAETTNLTADEAASAFAKYANITGMAQGDFERLGSVVVELGNNMATTEADIVNMGMGIASAGRQVGMTDAEIMGMAAGLSSLGLEAQAGGTAFSKLLVNMQVAAETGSDALKDYAEVAGMSADAFAEAFRSDAAGAVRQFMQGLSTGSKSAIAMLDEMGIKETRFRDMLLRSANASELFGKAMGMANGAWQENNALSKEAAVRYQTTESRMQMLQKSMQKTAMSFGQSIMPYLEKGMDAIGDIIDRFSGLDRAQQDSIVKWGAMAAAAGPAISLLGKANTTIGTVSGKLADFAHTLAESSGGAGGVMSALSGLVGPAGMAALAVGAALAAKKLFDMATGAEAARQAQARLNETVKEWGENVTTAYEKSQGLSGFGLGADDFSLSGKDSGDWLKETIETWTDGKKETDQIVKDTVKGFTDGTDKIREGLKGLKDSAGGGTVGDLDKDLASLDEIDGKIESLMKKRQNGTLSEGDIEELQSLIDQRDAIKVKYQLVSDTDGAFDKIVQDTESALSRGGDRSTAWADAYAAASQGVQAYTDSLNSEYDARYRVISAMEDGEEKEKQMAELRDWYNEKAAEGQEKYAQTLAETAKMTGAFDAGGTYESTMQGVEAVEAAMEKLASASGPEEVAAATEELNNALEGLDEAQVAEMTAALVSMSEGGADMSEGMEGALTALSGIKEMLSGGTDLFGEAGDSLDKLFGEGLDEEVLEINATLKTENLSNVYDAWAAGEHADIVGRIDDTALEDPELTGNITKIDWPENSNFEVDAEGNITSVVTPEGNVYTIDAEGNVTGVTTPEGAAYAVDIDGNVTKVTTAEGVTYAIDGAGRITSVTTADGVTATVDAEGNVTDIIWPESSKKVFDAEGNITSVTTEDGLNYTLDGKGRITSVTTADGVTATVDAEGNVTDITWPEGSKKVFDAEGNITSVTTEDGLTYTLDGNGRITSVTTADGVTGSADVFGSITALGLGEELEIPPIPVKAEVTEIEMPEETPVYSTARGKGLEKLRDKSEKAVQENPAEKVPFIGGITDSTAEMVERVASAVRNYNAALAEGDYEGAAAQMELIGSAMGSAQSMAEFMQTGDKAAETAQYIASGLAALSDPNVEVTPEQAESLKQFMGALADTGEYDPSGLEAIAQAFQGLETSMGTIFEGIDGQGLGDVLRNAIAGIDSGSLGGDLIAGVGSGMASANVSGDAQTAVSGIEQDLRSAAGAHSPAQRFVPIGGDILSGIGEGMKEQSLAAVCQGIMASTVSAFSGMPQKGQIIGTQFGAGLKRGLNTQLPGIVSRAKQAAKEIEKAFRDAWDIHSPSRVAENLTEMFGAGLEKGMRGWPTVSADSLRGDIDSAMGWARAAGTAAGSTTNNNNNSVNLAIDSLEVADRQDVEALAYQIASMTRRSQRARGMR